MESALTPVPVEALAGRVAAEDVLAPVSLPPFHSSAMDGYACRRTDLKANVRLTLVGESLAGHPFRGQLSDGQCIRITTGAAVPDSADTVVIQENTEVHEDRVTLIEAPTVGANIRAIGHDVQRGERIARRGQLLNPMDLGWIAACGVASVSAFRAPRVAVFSTGDELIEPGVTPSDGQIFDSNRYAVAALLSSFPAEVSNLGILPDQPDAIEHALTDAAGSHDLLLTSGGVSVGDADYVKEVVESLGALSLWRLNLKPGKPLAFGHVGNVPFLGLPGNPVSTIVTFLLIARPLVLKLAGAESRAPLIQQARLSSPIRHTPGREEYQRGILSREGVDAWVEVSGDQSSNRLATFNGANCLIRIPKEAHDLDVESTVDVLPFYGLLS
jgi:molybdopterin molybdotransferase